MQWLFCSVAESITIVVLGSISGLKNVSQIHQWATGCRASGFLKEKFGFMEINAMGNIIGAIVLGVLATICFVFSYLQFNEKGGACLIMHIFMRQSKKEKTWIRNHTTNNRELSLF